ncbi:zinc finger protein 862-like isoform X2 [Ruditapes philippinarum]|nr:zinc finger protein 862-like isoform X2 [Ruditapes philippinarum]
MMCTLCIRHQKRPKKAAFGNATWVDKPCTWLVKDALRRHERSDSHDEARAFEAGRLAPSNNVEAAVEEANSLHTKARVSAFRNLYWLMKREMPHTTNYLPLNELCKLQGANILNNLHQGENNKGESQRFIQEAVLTMGNLIRQSILDDVKVSPWYSIMIDETTDITVVSEMIIYIRYLKDGVSKTDFIGILPLPDGKADTITETLVTFLTEDLGLQLEKMCALGSDGAKVMVGRQNGVAAQLRRRVPHLVNNHCVAHRLALAVGQAAKGVPYLQKFKDIIGDLHRF